MHDNRQIGPMMTSGEAAQFLNVHINTVRRWGDLGIIEPYRIGPRGDRRFLREQVIDLLHGLRKNNGDVIKTKVGMINTSLVSQNR